MAKYKTKNLILFYFLMSGLMFSANLVHPITPSFLKSLNYPDYMFGLAFGLMSFGAFILSPMWSELAHKVGCIKILSLGILMYGVGQAIFAFSRTELLTAFGRLFAGMFTSAWSQSQILYLRESYDSDGIESRISFGIAVQVFAGALGYFAGGFIGHKSIMLCFYIQIILCILLSALAYIFFIDSAKSTKRISIDEINPFKSIMDVKKIMTKEVGSFFLLTILCAFAFVSFDTTYNYYIKDVFQLPPTYNGLLRAIIGISAFLLNISINKYIAKKFALRKSIRMYLVFILLLLFNIIFSNNIELFLLSALLYSIIDSMQKPLMQIIATQDALVFGGYNSVQYFGMVLGSFSAGWLYTKNSKFPFVSSAILIIIAIVVSILNQKYFEQENA